VRDVTLAARWYVFEAPHTLAQFEHELNAAFRRISEAPHLYQLVHLTVRRAPLRRFPFSVFYQVLPEWVEVIAVLHQSRDPETWRRRL